MKLTHFVVPQNRSLVAIRIARDQLQTGNVSLEAAQSLIDESKDILAPALDAKVFGFPYLLGYELILLNPSTSLR